MIIATEVEVIVEDTEAGEIEMIIAIEVVVIVVDTEAREMIIEVDIGDEEMTVIETTVAMVMIVVVVHPGVDATGAVLAALHLTEVGTGVAAVPRLCEEEIVMTTGVAEAAIMTAAGMADVTIVDIGKMYLKLVGECMHEQK